MNFLTSLKSQQRGTETDTHPIDGALRAALSHSPACFHPSQSGLCVFGVGAEKHEALGSAGRGLATEELSNLGNFSKITSAVFSTADIC